MFILKTTRLLPAITFILLGCERKIPAPGPGAPAANATAPNTTADPHVYDKAKYHYDGEFPRDLAAEKAFVKLVERVVDVKEGDIKCLEETIFEEVATHFLPRITEIFESDKSLFKKIEAFCVAYIEDHETTPDPLPLGSNRIHDRLPRPGMGRARS